MASRHGFRRSLAAEDFEESRFRIAFLCGSVENEADVRDLFDLVVCLVIDEDTLRHRLATRRQSAGTGRISIRPDSTSASASVGIRPGPMFTPR
ncbi:hypothetical protein [Phytohabitans rumicis]|uniref:hypothetical protein n=1 Tax=Phytohabitans rumicis TaxID=1076125 RepID=UPI001567698A|nr:hypothetical protein [Phytohabitans rumicis]